MKRRGFVSGAAAAFAVAMWPAFLREAFAADKACDPKGAPAAPPDAGLVAVTAAFRRASRARKPLLVLVIPANDDDTKPDRGSEYEEKLDRGHAFGELLNHGSDKDVAPLADCEVVCATMAALRKVVPSAGQGEPLMVLVRANSLPATARQLDAELPSYLEMLRLHRKLPYEGVEREENKIIERRIAILGKLLRKELGDDRERVAERATEARARLRDKPPSGTRWGRDDGCATVIEGAEDSFGVACGMGHVPKKSRRFLYFFTRRVL